MLICMFPGQGSQAPGMGKELFAHYPKECAVAQTVLGYSLLELCAGEDTTRLADTSFAQPAIFFVSCLAYLERKKNPAFSSDAFLGHSLGLYAALFAADVFDISTGLTIVAERGRLMASVVDGGMVAAIGDDVSLIESILVENHVYDIDVANYNSQRQVVLSGMTARLTAICSILSSRGIRCVPLNVSGAFHSRFMEPVRRTFADFLSRQSLRAPTKRIISSTSAETIDSEHLVEELSFQLTKPVRWFQTIRAIRARCPDVRFEEVGPGNILTRLDTQLKSESNLSIN